MPIARSRVLLLTWLIGSVSFGCATEAPKVVIEPSDTDSQKERTRRASIERITRLEDQRVDGGSELQRLALMGDDGIRMRAVRALGRLPFPEHGQKVTDSLAEALSDNNEEVRAIAAFGLGLRADPRSSRALLAAWEDPSELVRARLVEAGSRMKDAAVREEVLYALADPSPLVRREAVTAASRWDPKSSASAVVDSALANTASKAPAELRMERWGLPDDGKFKVAAEDGEVIWRTLFALARRKSERGREVFYLWCHAENNVNARIFATRGLSALEKSTLESREALRECLEDEDWRVVVEAAVGLGNFPEPTSLPPMERALAHQNPNVRVSVTLALGSFLEERRLVRPILERLLIDTSANVRGAAIRSLAQLYRDEIAADLGVRAIDHDPMVRKAVANSCQYLFGPAAVPLLTQLTHDKDPSVAYDATTGLGNFLDQGGRTRVHELLVTEDNGLRLGAVLALQKSPRPEDLEALMRCFGSSSGDISGEIQAEILNTAAKLQDDRALEILLLGTRSSSTYLRHHAQGLLDAQSSSARNTVQPAKTTVRAERMPTFDSSAPNPRVEIRTTKGTMVFELLPKVAPMHCHSFLELTRQGAYDGLRFHRVVPDFVAQGGDYRGDGNGGTPWRGSSLRHEFNELKYVEGSLGMPRNANPNSGGSQIFVTHRPTPHLDGRYTLFGQLVQGFDTLRQLEENDLMLEVRVRGE
ncbi:MAG: cyclophilin family peptidyl-prolyl cis-trans isomerase [Planctomycetota bacterium]|jgi:cyclophilin family peptidyl-prolyl cis-trans isomerase